MEADQGQAGRMTPKPVYEPYDDAFDTPCGWPTSMKLGDGSTDYCHGSANCRVIFPSGGRSMLCAEHRQALEERYNKTAKERGDA